MQHFRTQQQMNTKVSTTVRIICLSPEVLRMISVCHLSKMPDINMESCVSECLQLQQRNPFLAGSSNKENLFYHIMKALRQSDPSPVQHHHVPWFVLSDCYFQDISHLQGPAGKLQLQDRGRALYVTCRQNKSHTDFILIFLYLFSRIKSLQQTSSHRIWLYIPTDIFWKESGVTIGGLLRSSFYIYR